jgi:hypothetical protein
MGDRPENDLSSFIIDKRSGLAKLLGDGPIPTSTFDDFAGCGGRFQGRSFSLRSLSAHAVSTATAAAAAWLTGGCGFKEEHLYTPTAEAFFNLEVKVQILTKALVDPSDPRKTFADNPAQLREGLEPDEVSSLFERWTDWQESRSPLASLRTVEAIDAELDALGKGQTASTLLLRYDSGTLRFMLQRAGERLRTLTRPNSSVTS